MFENGHLFAVKEGNGISQGPPGQRCDFPFLLNCYFSGRMWRVLLRWRLWLNWHWFPCHFQKYVHIFVRLFWRGQLTLYHFRPISHHSRLITVFVCMSVVVRSGFELHKNILLMETAPCTFCHFSLRLEALINTPIHREWSHLSLQQQGRGHFPATEAKPDRCCSEALWLAVSSSVSPVSQQLQASC